MEEKKTLLSKLNIKDYKNDFELVLEKKKYEEEAQSLLLNIFYKIENFYKDYMAVKIECEQRNKYLEDFIDLIQKKCKKITIIQPQQVKNGKKYKVDKKLGVIECIPNEYVLFDAVNELKEKNYENEKYLSDDFVNKCVNYIVSKGMAINDAEPVRDFNGWSWNVQIDDNNNVTYNLIYQNLLMIFGYQFLKDNLGKLNISETLKKQIIESGFGNIGEQFVDYIIEVCVILYSNLSDQNHEKCLKYKNRLKNKINMLSNREESVNDKYKNSSNISDKIKVIEEMLDDIDQLREEYQKSIKENKQEFIGLSDFVEAKEKEKNRLLKEISENKQLVSTKKYITEQDEYKIMLSYFESLKEDNKKINVQSRIIKIQRTFLQCCEALIDKAEQKKDIVLLVKKIRYYSNVLIKKDKKTIEQEQIKKMFEQVSEKLIDKAIENKIFDIGFKTKKLNYEIISYIFKTKIIQLENIVLKIKYIENNKLQVEYYDSKTLEYKQIYQIPIEEEIINKKDKKIKLFKIGG